MTEIRRILGTDREWTVTMVGVGNLGRAPLGLQGISTQGFRIVAAFDATQRGRRHVKGVPIYDVAQLSKWWTSIRLSWG